MNATWFSAMLRFVIAIGGRPERFERSLLVFLADGWEAAQRRAVELGRAAEETFENVDGVTLAHRLVAVETLDLLGDRITDGREIFAEPAPLSDEVDLERLAPERSVPGQSGV